jgi:hypothetical protein
VTQTGAAANTYEKSEQIFPNDLKSSEIVASVLNNARRGLGRDSGESEAVLRLFFFKKKFLNTRNMDKSRGSTDKSLPKSQKCFN